MWQALLEMECIVHTISRLTGLVGKRDDVYVLLFSLIEVAKLKQFLNTKQISTKKPV